VAEPFIGQIALVGFNFPPSGWASCNGATLSLQQNTALFALLGIQYGGNGTTNFQLPNLVGRAAMGQGQGPGLTSRIPGDTVGSAAVTLTTDEMATHTHRLNTQSTLADRASASGGMLATTAEPLYGAGPVSTLAPSLGVVGGGQPHENMQPYVALNFVIALNGQFPAFD